MLILAGTFFGVNNSNESVANESYFLNAKLTFRGLLMMLLKFEFEFWFAFCLVDCLNMSEFIKIIDY